MSYLRCSLLAGSIIFFLCIKLDAQDIGGDIVTGFEERKARAITALNKHTLPDTNRVIALIDVLATALIQKQRQELLPYCEEAMALSRKLDYAEGLARCYIWKGHYFKASLDRAPPTFITIHLLTLPKVL